MKLTRLVSTFLVLLILSPLFAAELPSVPEGYTIEVVAEHPLVTYPMMAGFDERGRLFIAENIGVNDRSEQLLENPQSFIRMIEDTDGDGKFDKSTIFADKLTFPMGALWHRGALYVASPPYIWRLEDTDNDGVADKREQIVSKFGFSGNAASIHGCFLGPDGRIYWCDGRHGHEFKNEEGEVTSQGLAARIFSCKPDGSDPQIFCGGGMDNPVEIDFMPTGEMLGTVNILLNGPRVDCLMHWVEGGNYPHHPRAYSEMPRTGELMQPMTRFGHVAVSGMTRYRSDQLGAEYQNNVFTSIFNLHKVVTSSFERVGSTFQTVEKDFMISEDPDFHPTDVLEDADGSLLVINTGGWFRLGCPTSQIAKPEFTGAIYRIRKVDAPEVVDPRGLDLDWTNLTSTELITLLTDSRPAVAARAIDELALQGDSAVPELTSLVTNSEAAGALSAVWALRRMETEEALTALRAALNAPEHDVRLAAIRSVGGLRDILSLNLLLPILQEPDLTLKQTSATAIGRIIEKQKAQIPTVIQERVVDALFAQLLSPEIDRITEHSLLYALIRFDQPDLVAPYLDREEMTLKRGALITLDQMPTKTLTQEQVIPLLTTTDPGFQNEVLQVISAHEGWAGETLGLLAEWLEAPELTEDQAKVLRSFLVAQTSDESIQKFIAANYATTSNVNKLLLLEVIGSNSLPALPIEWEPVLQTALVDQHPELKLAAVKAIGQYEVRPFEKVLMQLISDEQQAAPIRVEATRTLRPCYPKQV
ncbi:MAG: HEAT repeat domain-containing protein [Planctomycetaceae bacterium]